MVESPLFLSCLVILSLSSLYHCYNTAYFYVHFYGEWAPQRQVFNRFFFLSFVYFIYVISTPNVELALLTPRSNPLTCSTNLVPLFYRFLALYVRELILNQQLLFPYMYSVNQCLQFLLCNCVGSLPPRILRRDQVSACLLICCTRYYWMVEFGGPLKIKNSDWNSSQRPLSWKGFELGSCLIRNLLTKCHVWASAMLGGLGNLMEILDRILKACVKSMESTRIIQCVVVYW